MIDAQRRGALLPLAQSLARGLLGFRSQEGTVGVAPSFLGPVIRFVQSNGRDDLAAFLRQLPGSHVADKTGGSLAQVKEVTRQVAQIDQKGPRSSEEMLFVLGWARRLMTIDEERRPDGAVTRPAGAAGPAHGGGSRGGPGRGGFAR